VAPSGTIGSGAKTDLAGAAAAARPGTGSALPLFSSSPTLAGLGPGALILGYTPITFGFATPVMSLRLVIPRVVTAIGFVIAKVRDAVVLRAGNGV
jgi:hypothetical protein